MKIKALKKVKNAVVSLKVGETAYVQARVGQNMIKAKEAVQVEQTTDQYIKESRAKDVHVVIQKREEV